MQKNKESSLEDGDFSVTTLTDNALRDIVEKVKLPEAKTTKYVLQVVESKVFTEEEKKKSVKQRLMISDGKSLVIAMITDKMDKAMDGKTFPKYSIIRTTGNFMIQVVGEKQVLIFKDFPELIYTGLKKKIGNPTELEKNLKTPEVFDNSSINILVPVEETAQYQLNMANSAQKSTVSTNNASSNQNSAQKLESPVSISKAQEYKSKAREMLMNMNDIQYTPIKSLNAFLFDWKIKARVTKKQQIRTWKNANSTGHVMNAELIDNQGTQILATFYNDIALKYDDILKEDKVYLWSNGNVKIANKKYTSIKNDYCIVFDKNSEIEEIDDDKQIQQQGFNFVTIDEINDYEQSRTVDTIGVVTNVGQISNFVPKNGGASKDKRSIQIADESGLAIQVTIWGKNASSLNFQEGHILAVRGAKVSDYAGKTLNIGDDHCSLYLDIDHLRTRELKQWNKQRNPDNINSVSTSIINGNQNQNSERADNFRLISEVVRNVADEGVNIQAQWNQGYSQPKAKFFKITGFVSFLKHDDKFFYLSCPDCRRKVSEELEGFRCDYCNKSFIQSNPTYIMTAKVSDPTGDMYIQFARELGDPIMNGLSASDFKDVKEQLSNPEEMKLFFAQECLYKTHSVVIKAQNDQYRAGNNGDDRIKYTAVKVLPQNFTEDNQMLLKRLRIYEKMNGTQE